MEGLVDAVYCITLRGDQEGEKRWEKFKQRIPLAMRVRRFDALDLRGDRWERHACLLSSNCAKELHEVAKSGWRQRHEQLTPGALGCYLSHLAILRSAYAQNQCYTLVFEDDALLQPDLLPRLAEQVQGLPKGWDMLLLGYASDSKNDTGLSPVRLRRFYRLHAYLVNQQGMAKILALCLPIRKQLDSALSDWSERIAIYGAVPQLVANDESFPTTIQLPLKLERKSLLPNQLF
jgi:GR25 family glycosyltransferase involved in LPS biosynthesis